MPAYSSKWTARSHSDLLYLSFDSRVIIMGGSSLFPPPPPPGPYADEQICCCMQQLGCLAKLSANDSLSLISVRALFGSCDILSKGPFNSKNELAIDLKELKLVDVQHICNDHFYILCFYLFKYLSHTHNLNQINMNIRMNLGVAFSKHGVYIKTSDIQCIQSQQRQYNFHMSIVAQFT